MLVFCMTLALELTHACLQPIYLANEIQLFRAVRPCRGAQR